MRDGPKYRMFSVRRVHEVVKERASRVLLLDVIEYALTEIRAGIRAGESPTWINDLVVAARIDALVIEMTNVNKN